MKNKASLLVVICLLAVIVLIQCTKAMDTTQQTSLQNAEKSKIQLDNNKTLVNDGRQIFRFDTFGDEDFWSGVLHIDKAIAGQANGGFGPGVSPQTALAVGLKVDAEALPPAIVSGIQSGTIDLNNPATTLALLQLNAVVGVKGTFINGALTSVGITCASCHSTVDNSVAPGIGKRLDGWPNRDLNVGAIVSLTDNAQPLANLLHVSEPALRSVLGAWGPGKYNAVLNMDGKAVRPDGKVAANLIPAAFGLEGVNLTTYTGWGDISYWNAYVGTLQMHGKGSFSDPRLNDPVKYPIAVENGFYHVVNNPDLLTSKLPALRAYQHSLKAPKPPAGSFNPAAAGKGKALFLTKAKCVTCHSGPLLTDNSLRNANEIGIDDFEAKRSPTGKYRTPPLGGLFARSKGGFYHDGRFANYLEVVNHYNQQHALNLTTQEKLDLVEYLKSL
jgi:hypothetical protein